ncbi:MAG: hypothetical protein QXW82_00490 [Candidatus Bathyarchaeia archaeon]
MQSVKEVEIPRKGRSSKRTTIVLEKEEREFIDSLIRDGKEAGIKPLISKMLDIYRSMMIYDWRYPGEYYCGISRIAFMNIELANILIQSIPEGRRREVGRRMGEAAKVSMEATLGIEITNRDKWEDVFKRLRVQGFGDFYVKDKYLLIKMPFISEPEVWAGFLEGLLSVKLDIKTTTPPFVFEIKQAANSKSGATSK